MCPRPTGSGTSWSGAGRGKPVAGYRRSSCAAWRSCRPGSRSTMRGCSGTSACSRCSRGTTRRKWPVEEHDIVEDRLGLRIVGVGEQLIGEKGGVLRAGDLRGVQSAADVDDYFSIARQSPRLRVREAVWMREPHVHASDLIESREV